MKRTAKIIVSLVLFSLFLIVCLVLTIGGYTTLLLRTYSVFTQREPVAEVTISEMKEDSYGEYADVYLKVSKKENTALSYIFGAPSTPETVTDTDEYSFKVYGDTVHLSGPIIKFHNGLIFINFQTIFKLGQVYGRYNFDNQKEQNRPDEAFSSFEINGGISDWQNVFEWYQNDGGLWGRVTRLLVDSMQISSEGQAITSQPQKYTVFMTNEGFLWVLEQI
jgi:hypothetical protein